MIKEYNINKELLSKVVGYSVVKVYEDITDSFGHQLRLVNILGESSYINLYELVHKYKQWVKSRGVQVFVVAMEFDGKYQLDIKYKGSWKILKGTSESNLIFKACEWMETE